MAIKRYLSDNVARVLIPMQLTADRVADARGVSSASLIWQDARNRGETPQTWLLSDAVRQAGAEAMLYSSRSRPDLTHVVVFCPECLHSFGSGVPYIPEKP